MKMGHSHDDWGVESVDPSTSSSTSSFRRVVNKVNSNAKCRCCLWVLAVICACNIMFMLIGYDRMVNTVAVGQMVLQEGSGPKYEAWMQAPMPVYYKVTVFNLTNPEEFMNGARPRLKECGPYTYRMLEEKTEVEFFDNNTVTYRTKPMYLFEPSLSVGSEEDVIRTVNIPLVNAADAVKYNEFFKTVIQVAQKIHGFKTLRKLTVKELLWGYKSHVMDWARTLQELPYPHLQFGLLVGFNNTAQEPYTMYTGGSNPDFMNTIYAWNGKTKLDFWPGDECNAIRGTDASGFHPGVKTTDKLYIFNGQLCRSIPLEYQETVVHSGVETYRFVPPEDTFAYGEKYPQNDCFCGKEGCPPKGLLDMKPCYWGAAIAFSFPHFYQGDPTLRHIVRGLNIMKLSESISYYPVGLPLEGSIESLPLQESTRTDDGDSYTTPTENLGRPLFSVLRSNESKRKVAKETKAKIRYRCCGCCLSLNRPYLVVGLLLSAIGTLFSYFFIEVAVEKFVESKMVFRDGSSQFLAWKNGEPPIMYKIYFFNITNEESFMRGARPRLQELGPYSYEVIEAKEFTNFEDSDTLTFSPRPVYKFLPHLSVGPESDPIVTINMPLVNAGVQVEGNLVMENILRVASRIHLFDSLRRVTVGQLLWGHRSAVLEWARQFKNIPYPHKHFGLMVGVNDTIQKSYTVATGASDITKILEVKAYDGKETLNAWNSEACDRIKGTLVGGFHPGILPSETLNIFSGQLCRSLPLIFDSNLTHSSGLEVYRFVPPADTFSYGHNSPNQCFCSPLQGCPPDGVLDVRSCFFGAAVAFSFPHFYQGDPSLRHVIRGLRPDPELHGTEFDIYPKLGVPLRVKLRMQMNVVIDGNQALQRDRHFDIVFPVFWFEAGIDSLPLEMVGKLRMAQDLPSVVKTTSLSICAALSVLFLVLLFASSIAAWCGITERHSRTSTPEHLPNAPWPVKHTQRPNTDRVFFNSSGYAPGSMTSLTNGVESFPKPRILYPTDEIDTLTNRTFDHPPSEDQPPAYSSKSDTQTSSASLLSVEIHKSASVQCIDNPSNNLKAPEDEFLQKRYSSVSDDSCFSDNDVERVTPSTPPVPLGSPVIAPLAKSENSNLDQHVVEPLATSSPHDSPNSSAMLGSDLPSAPPPLELERSYDQKSTLPPPLESHL